MFRIPHRISLVAQTMESLREYIAGHKTGEALPGERQLCELLKVSRVTLRAALTQLERDKLITVGRGRSRCILSHLPQVASVKRNVLVLAPAPLHQLDPRAIFMLDALREGLTDHDLHLDFICQPSLFGPRPEAGLDQLQARLRPACWVLYRSTQQIQKWMVKRRLSAVLIGTPHEGIALPAVDVAHRAACRHAAERLLARGHRSIALLNPRSVLGGVLESTRGFNEISAPDVMVAVVDHDGTPAGVQVTLERLLARKTPPTGFVVSRSTHALTALGHLISRGFKVPREVAVIALEYDSFLEHTVPKIAHYYVNSVTFSHKVCRTVLAVASGGDPAHSVYRVMPELVRGETLG